MTDISRDQSGQNRGYYCYLGAGKFLHTDLVVRRGITFQDKVMGFWKTRALAEEALRQFVTKEKMFESRAG